MCADRCVYYIGQEWKTVGDVSVLIMVSENCPDQVRVKGTIVNVRMTMDGMIIILVDLDANPIQVHTSLVCVCTVISSQKVLRHIAGNSHGHHYVLQYWPADHNKTTGDGG